MNKYLKTLTVITVLIMIIACMGTLVACTDNSDDGSDKGNQAEEYVFKFTVLDADGNAVSGVYVKLCQSTNCKLPKATDANGVVMFTVDDFVSAEEVYDIHVLTDMSSSEEYDLGQTSVTQKDYTLTLSAEA